MLTGKHRWSPVVRNGQKGFVCRECGAAMADDGKKINQRSRCPRTYEIREAIRRALVKTESGNSITLCTETDLSVWQARLGGTWWKPFKTETFKDVEAISLSNYDCVIWTDKEIVEIPHSPFPFDRIRRVDRYPSGRDVVVSSFDHLPPSEQTSVVDMK